MMAQRTVCFSGLEWNVRDGFGGPGPNSFSASAENVWTDSLGFLHLKIRKIGDQWLCSEVYLQQSYGYGEYLFEVQSDLEAYDPNIVVGLFTYESDDREIDIEFARWGSSGNDPGWYTVQPPPYSMLNQSSFQMGLSRQSSTHIFHWTSDSIQFKSYRPFVLHLPPVDSLMHQWTYQGIHNPPVGGERVHINFWLFKGEPPLDLQEAELVISRVIVPGTHSVKESLDYNDEVIIYPVPSRDRIYTPYLDERVEECFIVNMHGRIVKRVKIRSHTDGIDISDLPAGTYCIMASTSAGITGKSFVVAK
jgi:hypothetical protein